MIPKRLKPLPRETIADLFDAALVGLDKEKPGYWLDAMEAYTRLVELEHQTSLYNWAHRAETQVNRSPRTGEPYKKRMPNYG